MANLAHAVVLFSVCIVGAAATSGATAATQVPPPITSDPDLKVFADFFVPAKPIRDMVTGGCEVAYKTKLDQEAQIEQAIPGIHQRMIAAASQYCRANIDGWLDQARDGVKDHWHTALSARDIHRLAELLAQPADEANGLNIRVRPGETVKSAAHRAGGPDLAAQEANLEQRERAFATTPGGAELLKKVAEYQLQLQSDFQSPDGPVKIIKAGIQAAHSAANEYAKSKGFQPVYP